MTSFFIYLRFLARCVWVQVLSWSGSLERAETELRENGAIVTLTLHRVLGDAAYCSTNSLTGIVLKRQTFAEMTAYLADHYEPVSFADAIPGEVFRSLRMAITFDDGWQDNYSTVLPVVKEHKLPVTIFVCPALVGQASPFWPEQAIALMRAGNPDARPSQFFRVIDRLKRCTQEQRERFFQRVRANSEARANSNSSAVDRTLSWEDIREMQGAGVTFGSHTNTHQILTTISGEGIRHELARSKATLEQMLGVPCNHFAYPNGDWSAETQRVVADAGFTRAMTTESGAWVFTSDPLAIPRMNVSEGNVVGPNGRFWPAMFQYAVVWKAWRAARRKPIAQKIAHNPHAAVCSRA